MKSRTVGIIAFIVFAVLAGTVLLFSNIKIEKNVKVTTQATNSQIDEQSQSGNFNAVVTKQQTASTESVNMQNQGTIKNSSDILLQKIVAEEKLDYSKTEQITSGKIIGLSSYLVNNQVMYSIELELSMGVSSQKAYYFCSYNTYKSLKMGDILTVSYKQTTENTFAIISAEVVQ